MCRETVAANGQGAAAAVGLQRTEGLQQWQPATSSSMVSFSPEVFASQGWCLIYPSQPVAWVAPDAWTYAQSTQEVVAAPCVSFVPFSFEGAVQPWANIMPQQPSLHSLAGRVWELSKDPEGCRHVQKALDDANDDERMALTSELEGHIWEAFKCPCANHVVQKCISTIRPQNTQFIIDELRRGGTGGVAQAARHQFGCRIIQRLLEHCPEEQLIQMLDDLLADGAALSSHNYGNYVMQHVLEFGSPEIVSRLTGILEQHIPHMNAGGHIGDVISKALTQPNNQRRQFLASALLLQTEKLTSMSCSRWGHLAVKEALDLVDVSERSMRCAELEKFAEKLTSSRYGRVVNKTVADYQKAVVVLAN